MIAARWAVNVLASSWSYETTGETHLERLRQARHPIVYAVWHGGLLPAVWRHRGEFTTLLVSRHRDGARLAAAVKRWGYRVVLGSSTRGAAGGLRGLVRVLEQGGNVAITPDGPRGPAMLAKPGAVAAAQRTGAAIVPVGVASSWGWRAHSWDRFLVPGPFAQVRMVYGEPFSVPPGLGGREEGLDHLQLQLSRVTRTAECGV
ncbi:MAG: lysophospholipid acyltransferase family protein [Gemmatimonadetes bacterium]|nr:lysophospholipid acyltransferase family protein [Gemmatimonadota bacterium]